MAALKSIEILFTGFHTRKEKYHLSYVQNTVVFLGVLVLPRHSWMKGLRRTEIYNNKHLLKEQGTCCLYIYSLHQFLFVVHGDVSNLQLATTPGHRLGRLGQMLKSTLQNPDANHLGN